MIDAGTAYWTGALANMTVIVGLLVAGVGAIRRRRVRAHKRFMLCAATLVGLFLVSYVLKIALLGREQLELWSRSYIWVLRLHEACIACLLAGGATAFVQALRLRFHTLREPPPPEQLPQGARLHRRAGWIATVGAGLGILTAGYVLQGMYGR